MAGDPDEDARLAEIDRLLNDPDSRMEPDRVWTLLDELAGLNVPEAPPLR